MPRMIDKLNTGERYMYLDAVSVMARGGTDMIGILRGGGNAGGGNQLAIGIKIVLSKTMVDCFVYRKMSPNGGKTAKAPRSPSLIC